MNKELEKAIKFMKFYQQNCLKKELENVNNYETIKDEEFISKNLNILLNYINNSIPKEEIEERIEIHKMAQEAFGEKYRMTKYTDDDIRARDFYMIVSEDLIVKELQELLEGK